MPFRFERLKPDGVIRVVPQVFTDSRGTFLELYKSAEFSAAGIPRFSQTNLSYSVRGVLRGLHYQKPPRVQGKLIAAVSGQIFDVAVDLRYGSPTFRQWVGVNLSAENPCLLYVPEGFAHGFCVLSDEAVVLYQTTVEYDAALDRGIRWDDPMVAVQWPLSEPILSARDMELPRLADIEPEFRYGGT